MLWNKALKRRPRVVFLFVFPILLFLILPTSVVIPMALTPKLYIEFPPSGISLHSFRDVLSDAAWITDAATSLKVAIVCLTFSVLLGTSAAMALHGPPFRGKGVVLGLILAPLIVPAVVLGLGDYEFFAQPGLVGTVAGIGLAQAVVATPLVFLAVQASLSGLDPALVRSAQSLGAGAPAVFRHVYWPSLLPGLVTGAIFAFAFSFDEVVIAWFLQGSGATTLPVKMFTDIQFELTPKIAAVATLLVILATIVMILQAMVILRRARRSAMRVDDALLDVVPISQLSQRPMAAEAPLP